MGGARRVPGFSQRSGITQPGVVRLCGRAEHRFEIESNPGFADGFG
jgi:hypothetical protein